MRLNGKVAIVTGAGRGIGSAVTARDLTTGKVERFVFLGPWDAARAKNIYSYRSPLGLAFMGKKKGDAVSLEAGGEATKW